LKSNIVLTTLTLLYFIIIICLLSTTVTAGGIVEEDLIFYAPLWSIELSEDEFDTKDTYSHSCTNTETLWSSEGRYFDGTDDIISCGSASILDNLAPITIIAWIYPESLGEGNSGYIINKNTAVTDGLSLRLDTNNQIVFQRQLSSTMVKRESQNNEITIDCWQQVTATWTGSGTATTIHIYVNASEVAYSSSDNGITTLYDDSNYNLEIGNRLQKDKTFDGYIGEVLIYDKVIAQDEITQNYETTKYRYEDTARKVSNLAVSDEGLGSVNVTWSNMTSGSDNYSIDDYTLVIAKVGYSPDDITDGLELYTGSSNTTYWLGQDLKTQEYGLGVWPYSSWPSGGYYYGEPEYIRTLAGYLNQLPQENIFFIGILPIFLLFGLLCFSVFRKHILINLSILLTALGIIIIIETYATEGYMWLTAAMAVLIIYEIYEISKMRMK